MDNPILITHPDQLDAFEGPALPWPYERQDLLRAGADAHWVCLDAEGQPAARCSAWWRQPNSWAGQRLGFIGHYTATNDEAALHLLEHVCRQLRLAGCTFGVGPLDGNTWRRYRFVIEPGPRPSFFLEPINPAAWPEQWTAAGFRQIAEYQSRLVQALDFEDTRGREAARRFHAIGGHIRPLAPAHFERELALVYPMVVRCFKSSFLYAPISRETFVEQHLPLRDRLVPELIRIAEHNGNPVGLLFGIPDLLQAARGERIDTSVIKTLVIDPARAYAGLGSALAAEFHRICRELGFKQVIHALMHQSNKSKNISARYGPVMRRYGLFGREL